LLINSIFVLDGRSSIPTLSCLNGLIGASALKVRTIVLVPVVTGTSLTVALGGG